MNIEHGEKKTAKRDAGKEKSKVLSEKIPMGEGSEQVEYNAHNKMEGEWSRKRRQIKRGRRTDRGEGGKEEDKKGGKGVGEVGTSVARYNNISQYCDIISPTISSV